jgi:hypothetical protein
MMVLYLASFSFISIDKAKYMVILIIQDCFN